MADLLDLARRCETAEGPNRDLSHAIWLAAIASDHHREVIEIGRKHHGDSEANFRTIRLCDGFHPTGSLDDALTLVPEGYMLATLSDFAFDGLSGCVLACPGKPDAVAFGGMSHALHVCAAALRARHASGGVTRMGGDSEAGSVSEANSTRPDAQNTPSSENRHG